MDMTNVNIPTHVKVVDSLLLEKVEYYFAENGITYIIMKENCVIELADSEREYELLMSKNLKLPLHAIVLLEPLVNISSESRKFWLLGKGKNVFRTEAVVTSALGPKIMLLAAKRFFPGFKLKIKIFKKLTEAENWTLNEIKKSSN